MSFKVSEMRQRAMLPASGSAVANKQVRPEVEEVSAIVSSASSGSESGSDESARPAMRPKPEMKIPAARQHMPRRARSLSTSEKPVATSPSVVLRTQSVRQGRRSSLQIVIVNVDGDQIHPLTIPKEDFRTLAEAKSGKQLRKPRNTAISNQTKVYVDVSLRWDDLSPASSARVAPVRGVLAAAAGKKLTLDLSNYRAGMLHEGARVRNETDISPKDWQKALRDIDVGLVVETLAEEVEGLVKARESMPELSLICRDQSLSTAVYPLVKSLASHAASLTGLKRLDLNRSSRSEEVCEARPPTDKVLARAYDKFVGRISMLIMACPSLQSLGLRMNGVHSYALAAMAHALSANQGLRRLDLSCNPLTTHPSTMGPANAGIHALARALRAGCKLETLDLSFCGLGNRDADLLAQALKHNKALGKIHLGGNPIAPDHAIFKDSRVVRIASAKTDD